MIRGLSQSDRPIDAINMFDKMRGQGFAGDSLTLIFVLKAGARFSDIVCGNKGHVHALKLGFDSYLYSEQQELADSVTIVKVILACSHLGNREKTDLVVRLFWEMMAAKVKPDEISVASVLSVCEHVGALDVGGMAEKALEVFQGMKEKDSVSWTSVVSGLAVNGNADHALELFSRMLNEGIRPTLGAFVGILLACTHAGLIWHMSLLSKCLLLSVPDVAIWRIVLGACNLHGNVVPAEIAKNNLLKLDP
ncbi:Pentatricopeptide repeat-containing protein [Actinidia chinensis var. chinensis]|uniref:Pentatricopeptide repeat-containing protein n=1 Tax=Actinidia chinensis var. chinensis TaxID=1590841 RepID=A0A2R6RQV7_ACTCC|nr:Pentatricopeptide repeat-containing protein [Actinidia chinensis var. chinensis]